MSKDNRLHSFTISPIASDIITGIRKKRKSMFVSDAIVHYQKWRHTDHTELKIDDYTGTTEMKDLNLALEEKQKLLETWVKRANKFQEELVTLQVKHQEKTSWFRRWFRF